MLWEYEPVRDKYNVPRCEVAEKRLTSNHRTHSHQNIEVIYVERGEMHLRLYEPDGHFRELKMYDGDAVIINGNIIHSTFSPEPPIDYLLGFILPNSLMPSIRLEAGETLAKPIHDASGMIRSLLFYMNEIQLSTDYEASVRDAMLVSLANTLTGIFLPSINQNPLRLKCGNTRLAVIDYACNNYRSSELSVEALAHAFGYSTRRLTDIFADNVGMNPKRYINSLRVSDAAKRLLTTDDNIESIARSVGFECPRSFYRVFREIAGVTPSEYRRSGEK